MNGFRLSLLFALMLNSHLLAQPADTLAALGEGETCATFEDMWQGFDAQAEPLEVETLKEWDEDNIAFRIVRFRIGVFKGKPARLAAVYGYPKDMVTSGRRLPGLLQIHGGGQYADANACRTNAKRGYATVSIAWAGRISAPDYRVSPAEVKLFWQGKADAPNYRLTTSTHKINAAAYSPPTNASLALEVRCSKPNVLVIKLDESVAEIKLDGGEAWQAVELTPSDFKNIDDESLVSFDQAKRLMLCPSSRLRPKRGDASKPRLFGAKWHGPAPTFRNLRWVNTK